MGGPSAFHFRLTADALGSALVAIKVGCVVACLMRPVSKVVSAVVVMMALVLEVQVISITHFLLLSGGLRTQLCIGLPAEGATGQLLFCDVNLIAMEQEVVAELLTAKKKTAPAGGPFICPIELS